MFTRCYGPLRLRLLCKVLGGSLGSNCFRPLLPKIVRLNHCHTRPQRSWIRLQYFHPSCSMISMYFYVTGASSRSPALRPSHEVDEVAAFPPSSMANSSNLRLVCDAGDSTASDSATARLFSPCRAGGPKRGSITVTCWRHTSHFSPKAADFSSGGLQETVQNGM